MQQFGFFSVSWKSTDMVDRMGIIGAVGVRKIIIIIICPPALTHRFSFSSLVASAWASARSSLTCSRWPSTSLDNGEWEWTTG